MKASKWNTRMLTTAAVAIAMSYLLSYIKLFSMPTGGSVTAASMLPLMLFAWVYGVRPGLLAGAAYGLLQFIQQPYMVHIVQVLADYPLAFASMGLAGLFRRSQKAYALPAGIVIAGTARFLCHLITGIVFFGSYAPAADFLSVLVYSATYNIGYMGVETAICAIVAAIPAVQNASRRLAA